MTVTANVEDALSTVGVTVPDADAAANFFASLLGANRVVRYPGRVSVPIGLSGVVDFVSADWPHQPPPRLVDIGTNHLCFTVGDIELAVSYLDSRSDVTVLGDVIEVPEGPIAGNKWVYFRSPWGDLFELQQWPEEPGYFHETQARLHHRREDIASALLPTCRGLDHTGYSVPDLDAAIARLVTAHSGTEVLRTDIAADRGFMTAQFDLDVEGTSQMAMVSVGDLNIELFEHHIGRQEAPRPLTANGGNFLTFRHGGAARLIPSSL